MSLHARLDGLRRVLVASCAMLASASLHAQTIADYSRAQRMVLENAMAQAAARSAGLAASAPAIAAQPAVAPPTLLMPAPARRGSQEPFVADPRVSGVFASAAATVAEVDVNGTAYLLGAGQPVPGTSWRVESVAAERVVLSRRESTGGASASESSHRVFSLPPLH